MAPTFQLFQNLPSELRLKIWRFSLQPRLIDVRLRAAYYPNGKLMPCPPEELVLPPPYRTPLPSTLHVCRESRNELLGCYQPFGGSTFYPALGIFINLEIDTAFCPDMFFNVEDPILPKTIVGEGYYFPDRSMLFRLGMDRDFAHKIQSLAVPAAGLKAQGTMTDNMIPVLRKFKNLKELILVGGDESGGIDFYPPQQRSGEPRLLPGRPCPDGECTFWLHMFAGLTPADLPNWHVKPAESLSYKLMEIGMPDGWKPPKFRFCETRRYENWDLVPS